MQTKTIALIGIVLIMAVGLLYKFGMFSSSEDLPPQQGTQAAGQAKKKAYVKAYKVAYGKLEEKVMSKGSLMPNEEVTITGEVSGKIEKVYFNEGDFVSKGDVLASLNHADLEAQLSKAKNEVAFLEKKVQREAQLFERGGISTENFENSQKDLNNRKSEVQLIEAQLSKTIIRAPFGGKIGFRYVSEGSFLPVAGKIAELVDASKLKLEFAIPEKYAAQVKRGFPVYFMVDGQSEKFEASIYVIDSKISASTRTIGIRAIADNRKGLLVAGAFASVEVIMRQIPKAISIPTEAIIPEMNNKRVYVVKNGVVASQQIETGLRLPDVVEVTQGISLGDTVITSGILQIRPGEQVEVTEWSGSTVAGQ